MTANELLRRLQQKIYMLSSGDVPIKYNGEDMDVYIELIEGYNGYYINIVSSQDEPNAEETELNSLAFLEQLGYTCIPPKESWPPQDSTPTYASTEYKVNVTKGELDYNSPEIKVLVKGPSIEEKSEIPTELEEEIDKYISENIEFDRVGSAMDKWNKGAHLNRFDIENIARHFAEWQKKQDQETIELAEDHAMMAGRIKAKEEFDKKCQGCFDRDEVFRKGVLRGAKEQKKQDELEFCYEEAFDNGVKYTKEQMMKEAVEGSVIVAYIAPSGEQYGNIVSTDVEIDRFSLNEGDKVKLIILKDDAEG